MTANTTPPEAVEVSEADRAIIDQMVHDALPLAGDSFDVRSRARAQVRIAGVFAALLARHRLSHSIPQPLASDAGLREALERPTDEALDEHLPESVRGAKRCGMQRSAWLPGWYVPWSPRNDNENAEGPWSDWVLLAEAILQADASARAALEAAK